MIWQSPVERLALLELLARGKLKRRRSQGVAWDALAELSWTRRSGRRDELSVVEARRAELVALLEHVWPEWSSELIALTARGLPPTPDGWASLEDARRAQLLPALPAQINRRTAAALAAPHSKGILTERRLAALADVAPTHDGSVRMRPPRGLVARSSRGSVDLGAIASVLGDVSLSERALLGGLSFEGPLRAVLLVENLGPFCDLPALEGWLFAHVPGWNTSTAKLLIERLTHVPIIHFGDLDPNGVRIFRHLRAQHAGLGWFVPPFWAELVATKSLPGTWPADIDLADAPKLIQELTARGRWLEQEPLAVDPRTPAALAAML
jgi:hypothetical protein